MDHQLKGQPKSAQNTPKAFLEELDKIKSRVIEELPLRVTHIQTLIEHITDNCFTTDSIDKAAWPPADFEPLHQSLHKLAGLAGSLGLEKESQNLRVLLDHIALWDNTLTPPDKSDWIKFALLAESITQSQDTTHSRPTNSDLRYDNITPGQGIWVVEDDTDQAELLRNWLEQADYQVRIFSDTDQFSQAYAQLDRPDIILMDMRFEDHRFAGAEQVARLRAQYGNLPPVVFISVQNDLPARLMAFRAGATRYLVKPMQHRQVINLIDELSGAIPASPFRVMLVDDDTTQLDINRLHLKQAGFEVRTLSEPLHLLEALEQFQPDVLILDIYMPEASGPELAAVLREDPRYGYLPIIFLSAEADPSKRLLALGMGGDDYLIKPVKPAHLVASVRARAKRARKLASIS